MKIESPILKKYIKELLKNDFKVYRNADQEKITYVHIEKGNNIGYIQADDYTGCLHFSTEHKPNIKTGTGYRMNEEEVCEPTIKDAESTFTFKPHWSRDRPENIVKYKNFDEYRKTSYGSILKYEEIKADDI